MALNEMKTVLAAAGLSIFSATGAMAEKSVYTIDEVAKMAQEIVSEGGTSSSIYGKLQELMDGFQNGATRKYIVCDGKEGDIIVDVIGREEGTGHIVRGGYASIDIGDTTCSDDNDEYPVVEEPDTPDDDSDTIGEDDDV